MTLSLRPLVPFRSHERGKRVFWLEGLDMNVICAVEREIGAWKGVGVSGPQSPVAR